MPPIDIDTDNACTMPPTDIDTDNACTVPPIDIDADNACTVPPILFWVVGGCGQSYPIIFGLLAFLNKPHGHLLSYVAQNMRSHGISKCVLIDFL